MLGDGKEMIFKCVTSLREIGAATTSLLYSMKSVFIMAMKNTITY